MLPGFLLLADDFYQYALFSLPVELTIEYLFPRPEIQGSARDRDNHFTPHDLPLVVRVPVDFPGAVVMAALAAGIRWAYTFTARWFLDYHSALWDKWQMKGRDGNAAAGNPIGVQIVKSIVIYYSMTGDTGIDFIDTSRAYTTSEHRIGLAMRQVAKRPVLATKSGARTADGILKDIDISLKEFGVESIEIYQNHGVRDEADYRQITGPGGALEGMP
jgi:hypothetical protein